MAPTDWGAFANHNACFKTWLRQVDALCDRFLDIQFESLIHEGDFDVEACFYDQDMSPDRFFRDCVVPYVAAEHGQDFTDDLIGDLAMWGNRSGADYYEKLGQE